MVCIRWGQQICTPTAEKHIYPVCWNISQSSLLYDPIPIPSHRLLHVELLNLS